MFLVLFVCLAVSRIAQNLLTLITMKGRPHSILDPSPRADPQMRHLGLQKSMLNNAIHCSIQEMAVKFNSDKP